MGDIPLAQALFTPRVLIFFFCDTPILGPVATVASTTGTSTQYARSLRNKSVILQLTHIANCRKIQEKV